MQEVKERDVPVLAGGEERGCFLGLGSQQGTLKCGEQPGVGRLHAWVTHMAWGWHEELLEGTFSGQAPGTV